MPRWSACHPPPPLAVHSACRRLHSITSKLPKRWQNAISPSILSNCKFHNMRITTVAFFWLCHNPPKISSIYFFSLLNIPNRGGGVLFWGGLIFGFLPKNSTEKKTSLQKSPKIGPKRKIFGNEQKMPQKLPVLTHATWPKIKVKIKKTTHLGGIFTLLKSVNFLDFSRKSLEGSYLGGV